MEGSAAVGPASIGEKLAVSFGLEFKPLFLPIL